MPARRFGSRSERERWRERVDRLGCFGDRIEDRIHCPILGRIRCPIHGRIHRRAGRGRVERCARDHARVGHGAERIRREAGCVGRQVGDVPRDGRRLRRRRGRWLERIAGARRREEVDDLGVGTDIGGFTQCAVHVAAWSGHRRRFGERRRCGKDHLAQPCRFEVRHADELDESGLDRLGRTAERVGERHEVTLAQRHATPRRNVAQLVDHRHVLAQQLVVVDGAAQVADAVADGEQAQVGAHLDGRALREELSDIDATRSGQAPEIAFGNLGAPTLVGGELAARQPGGASDFTAGKALLAADVAQLTADVLRRELAVPRFAIDGLRHAPVSADLWGR